MEETGGDQGVEVNSRCLDWNRGKIEDRRTRAGSRVVESNHCLWFNSWKFRTNSGEIKTGGMDQHISLLRKTLVEGGAWMRCRKIRVNGGWRIWITATY